MYLPFRVTETTRIPLGESRSERISTVEQTSPSMNSPEQGSPLLQGAPPVPRPEETNLSHSQAPVLAIPTTMDAPRFPVHPETQLSRLRSLSDQINEGSRTLEESMGTLPIGHSTFHALIHTCDQLISSIGDLYHTVYNRQEGEQNQEAREVLREAFSTLERVSSVITQRMS